MDYGHQLYHQLRQRRQHAYTLAISALCAYTTLLMATPKEKAHWTDHEVAELIDYLHTNRSASEGDTGNFSMAVFNNAAAHLSPHCIQGPVKTAKMCKQKWTSVRTCNFTCLILLG
jgi:hypothetical protein